MKLDPADRALLALGERHRVLRSRRRADDHHLELSPSQKSEKGEPAMARTITPREIDLARIRGWAAKKVPSESQHQVRLEAIVRGANVTLYELQPPVCPDDGPDWTRRPAAQLRHTGSGFWLLLWPDPRGRWQRYPTTPSPTRDLDALLTELDEDGICLFWLLRHGPRPGGA